MLWAAIQDWMCEPFILARSGLSVAEHQRRTVASLLELRSLASDLPWCPVIQGWLPEDYRRCVALYASAGVDLAAEPVVGVGSVCRRQATQEAAEIITAIRAEVPSIRIHAFGVKVSGLALYGSALHSSDSMAWSRAARWAPPLPGCVGHASCSNCPRWAFAWRERVLASLAGNVTGPTPHQTAGRMSAVKKRADVSRKLDADRDKHRQRLALAAFRDEVARLERDVSIRWAHQDGLSVRDIASLVNLSPARVGQILAESTGHVVDQIRTARERWGVDDDPADRAAADSIVAHLISDAPTNQNDS